MAEVAKENAMSSVFQNEITEDMFMTYQGVYYHLEIGEKEIEKLI